MWLRSLVRLILFLARLTDDESMIRRSFRFCWLMITLTVSTIVTFSQSVRCDLFVNLMDLETIEVVASPSVKLTEISTNKDFKADGLERS